MVLQKCTAVLHGIAVLSASSLALCGMHQSRSKSQHDLKVLRSHLADSALALGEVGQQAGRVRPHGEACRVRSCKHGRIKVLHVGRLHDGQLFRPRAGHLVRLLCRLEWCDTATVCTSRRLDESLHVPGHLQNDEVCKILIRG